MGEQVAHGHGRQHRRLPRVQVGRTEIVPVIVGRSLGGDDQAAIVRGRAGRQIDGPAAVPVAVFSGHIIEKRTRGRAARRR